MLRCGFTPIEELTVSLAREISRDVVAHFLRPCVRLLPEACKQPRAKENLPGKVIRPLAASCLHVGGGGSRLQSGGAGVQI